MRETEIEKIRLLLEEKIGRIKRPLTENTALERDLGITGDDAVEFILEFSNLFKVDISNFNITKYFEPEGDSLLPDLLRSITGKKKAKQKELAIGHLLAAIEVGRLDDEITNKS